MHSSSQKKGLKAPHEIPDSQLQLADSHKLVIPNIVTLTEKHECVYKELRIYKSKEQVSVKNKDHTTQASYVMLSIS